MAMTCRVGEPEQPIGRSSQRGDDDYRRALALAHRRHDRDDAADGGRVDYGRTTELHHERAHAGPPRHRPSKKKTAGLSEAGGRGKPWSSLFLQSQITDV